MRSAALLIVCYFLLPALSAQKLNIYFMNNHWIFGEKTPLVIIFTDKKGRLFSTSPGPTGRPINKYRLRVVGHNTKASPNYTLQVDVAKIKPGETIKISATYIGRNETLRIDTSFSLPEIVRFVPIYTKPDSVTPGTNILKNAEVYFADGSKTTFAEHPEVRNYFGQTSNHNTRGRKTLNFDFEATRYEPQFIWNIYTVSDNRILLRDTLHVNYVYTYHYSGVGGNGHQGLWGSNGSDGGTGENGSGAESGWHGGSGADGNDLQVYVNRIQDTLSIAKVKIIDPFRVTLLYIDLKNGGRVILDVKGGNGANGGDGGRGGDAGKANSDEGIAAGKSGDGGNGGNGGDGGNGGSAILYLDTFSMRYMTHFTVVNDGGKPGSRGSGGSSGSGEGGSSGYSGDDGRPGKKGKETVFIKWEE